MKKFTYLAFAALGMLAIVSCKKTVIDMDAQNSNANSANSVGNNSSNGSSTTAPSSSYNWTGTAPLSVKLDGVPCATDVANTHIELSEGNYVIVFDKIQGEDFRRLTITLSANVRPGSYYDMPRAIPTAAGISYQDVMLSQYWTGYAGQYKIITNDATTLEGYFYADMVDPRNFTVVAGRLTEGYFKVTKP